MRTRKPPILSILFLIVLFGLVFKALLVYEPSRAWIERASNFSCKSIDPGLSRVNDAMTDCKDRKLLECPKSDSFFLSKAMEVNQNLCEKKVVSWDSCRRAAALADDPAAFERAQLRCKQGVLGACVMGIWHQWGAGDVQGARRSAAQVCERGSRISCFIYGWAGAALGTSENFGSECSSKNITACYYAAGASKFRRDPAGVAKYVDTICRIDKSEGCLAVRSEQESQKAGGEIADRESKH